MKDVVSSISFQEDGTTPHTPRETIARLRVAFSGKLISPRSGDVSWPPRSPDLTSSGLFPLGIPQSKGLHQ